MYIFLTALFAGLIGASISNFYNRWRHLKKEPTKKGVLISFVAQLIFFSIALLIIQKINPEIKQHKDALIQEATEACNNFYLWLETSNRLFEDTLNRQINEIDSHGNLWMNAGMAMHIIEWAREFRERRDLRIDSILLTLKKYEDYGCDPDTLKYDRKLPKCFLQRLQPYMNLHKKVYNIEKLGLDTL